MDETTKRRRIELSSDEARYIDAKVRTGAFRTASEIVETGLTALKARETDFERWLRKDVVPVYDRMKTDPNQGQSIADIRRSLRARHIDPTRNA